MLACIALWLVLSLRGTAGSTCWPVVTCLCQFAPGAAVNEQVLRVNNERFMVPEALFHPSDIGLDQAGELQCTLSVSWPDDQAVELSHVERFGV